MQCAWLFRVAVLTLFFSFPVWSQTTPEPAAQKSTDGTSRSTLAVPAGTRVPMVLTHPVRTRHLRRGDDIYALITSPVVAGNDVVFPAGTYVRGRLQKFSRIGDRGRLTMESMTITLANGYVVSFPGTATMTSSDGYLLRDPGTGRTTAAFLLPVAGGGLGAVIGHAASGPETIRSCIGPNNTACASLESGFSQGRSTAIGAVAGSAVGGIGALLLLAKTRGFFLDAGTPMEIVLEQPLLLDRARVADAVSRSETHIVQPITPSVRPRRCGPSQRWCDGACVNVDFNDSHCGSCGNWCSAGETCRSGSCSKTF